MTTQLTQAQVSALEAQISRMNDEELVAFYEANHATFEAEGAEHLIAQAVEAHDRLEAARNEAAAEAESKAEAQQAVEEIQEAPRVYTEQQTRTNAARVIRNHGYEETALALELDLEGATGQELAWVADTIDVAMKATHEKDGKWIFHSWVRDCMRTVKNRAREAAEIAAEDSVDRLFFAFSNSIRKAEEIIGRIKRAPKFVQEKLLAEASTSLQRAEGTRWARWSLQALERLIEDGTNSSVSDLLADDAEIAMKVANAPERRKASTIIDAMLNRCRETVGSFQIVPGKTERNRMKADADRKRAERSARDQAFRESVKGNNPSPPKFGAGKKSVRRENDPHRDGK